MALRDRFHVRVLLSSLLLAGMLCPAPATADEPPQGDHVKTIGLLLPPEEAQANALREGALLALADATNSGAKMRLVIRGRTGQWGADAVEAARMVLDDGAVALIAPPDGSASHLALQVSGRTAVPVISLCADSSVSQAGVRWMLRMVPRTSEEAQTLFKVVTNRPFARASSWAAVVPEGRAGREITRDLKAAAEQSGMVTGLVTEAKSTQDFEPLVAGLMKSLPLAILVWLDPIPAGKLVKQFRAAGFTGTLAGPARLRAADFLRVGDDAVEGFVLPGPVVDGECAVVFKDFVAAYHQRFGHSSDLMASMSYDAARLLFRLISNTEQAALHEAFPVAFSLPGTSGTLAFDSEGNRKVALKLLTVRAGQFVAF